MPPELNTPPEKKPLPPVPILTLSRLNPPSFWARSRLKEP